MGSSISSGGTTGDEVSLCTSSTSNGDLTHTDVPSVFAPADSRHAHVFIKLATTNLVPRLDDTSWVPHEDSCGAQPGSATPAVATE